MKSAWESNGEHAARRRPQLMIRSSGRDAGMNTENRNAVMRRSVRAVATYAWVGPNTLIGLLAGVVVLCCGGKARVLRGVAEFSGGVLGAACAGIPEPLRFSAMTIGHVILGVSPHALDAAREHEHVHVRQYERWGPLFVFAYFGASAWQLLQGRNPYRDNVFERQAYAVQPILPQCRHEDSR